MKLLKKLCTDKYIILLTLLAIIFLISIIRYSLRSFDYPIWDEQHYMHMAANYFRILQEPSVNSINEMLAIAPFRQPGYPLFILPFLLTFGLFESYHWGLVTNGLLYAASIFGVYIIAKNFLSKFASFMAALIFMCYGWTLYYAHFTYSETATSAMCIWAIVFLLKSNLFQIRKYALLFGLFVGLAILTRWVAIIFILGPLVFVIYNVIKKKVFHKKQVIFSFILSLVVAFALCFYPYFVNFYWLADYVHGHRIGGPMWESLPEYKRNQFSLYNLTYYFSTFERLGIFYFVLICVGIYITIKKNKKLLIILSAVIFPIIFFTFFSILKDERFIIPIFPYLAILSASLFDYIKKKKIMIAFTIIVVCLSVATFLGTVWGKGPLKASLYSINVPFFFGSKIALHLTTISRPPNIYKKSGEEVVDYILADSKKSNLSKPKVLTLFAHRELDEPIMVYNQYHLVEPLILNNYLGTIISNPEKESHRFLRNVLNKNDYVLVKTGKITDTYFAKENYTTLIALNKLFSNYFDKSKNYAKKADFWIYQDSSTVTLFKKTKNIADNEIKELSQKFTKILMEDKNKNKLNSQ